MTTTAENTVVTALREGFLSLPVANATSINAGDMVYWNAGSNTVQSVASDANILQLLGVTHDSNPVNSISPTVYAGFVTVEYGNANLMKTTSGDTFNQFTPCYLGADAQTVTTQVTPASATVTIAGTITTNDTVAVNIAGITGQIYTVPATPLSTALTANAIRDLINNHPIQNKLVVATTTGSSGVITITALTGGTSGNQITLTTTVTGGHTTAAASAAQLGSGTGNNNILGYSYFPQEDDIGTTTYALPPALAGGAGISVPVIVVPAPQFLF